MPEQTALKMTREHADRFRSRGKPHGEGQNLTHGVGVVAKEWKDAGYPQLPPDPCPRGVCKLEKYVSRWDRDTWRILVKAGYNADLDEYKGASSGARRLAEWERQRHQKTGTLADLVEGALDLLERTPADDPLWATLTGREKQ